MKKLSRFEKYGLMAAVIIACTFFYMKRVYEPQEKVLKKTIRHLNQVIGEINSLKEIPPAASVKRTLEKRRQALAGLEEKLKGTAMRTGADREVTALLSEINKLMEANGLSVNTVVPAGAVKGRLFDWKLFKVDMNGRFAHFMAFLESVRTLKDAVRIRELVLEAAPGSELHVTFNLMI